MNEEHGFPKYQYSVFMKNGRDQQLVIRANTFEELVEAKKNIDAILGKVESTKDLASEFVGDTQPTPAVSLDDIQMCPEHNIAMPKKISKAGNEYWKHSKKVGDTWVSCFGKGYKA